MKIEKTLKRLRRAYEIIDGIPAKNINLDSWVAKESEDFLVHSVRCPGAWLATHPTFSKGKFALTHDLSGEGLALEDATEKLSKFFGIPRCEVESLFGYNHECTSLSHKKVWLKRAKELIESYEPFI